MSATEAKTVYVAVAQMGLCKVCATWEDLRCGSCFKCSPKVTGKVVSRGADGSIVHALWEVGNETNLWHVRVAPELQRRLN